MPVTDTKFFGLSKFIPKAISANNFLIFLVYINKISFFNPVNFFSWIIIFAPFFMALIYKIMTIMIIAFNCKENKILFLFLNYQKKYKKKYF